MTRDRRTLVARVGVALAVLALLAGTFFAFLPPSQPEPGTTTTTSEAPAPTVSDDEFATSVAAIDSVLAAADVDRCDVNTALGAFQTLPPVTTEAQVREAVALLSSLLETAAATSSAEESGTAASLRAAAAALGAEAESAGWDPQWLTTAPGPTALTSDEVIDALGAWEARTRLDCDPGATVGPQPVSPGADTGPGADTDPG